MKQDLYFESKGEALSVVKINGKETKQSAEWDVNYDGDLANIKLDTDTNGKKEHKKFKLTNDDINAMLNVPSHALSLDSRLQSDFLSSPTIVISEEPAYIVQSSLSRPKSGPKSRRSSGRRTTSTRRTASRRSSTRSSKKIRR
jgi:hypothetical protein